MNSDSSIKILFLAADPTNASRLRLGQELRDIRERLQLARLRDRFVLESRESVRPRDISQAIFDVEPQIIHFSGHGTNTGELCFENVSGEVQPVQPSALAGLFELMVDQVNCVVLNACYSAIQAEAIAKHIPYVVGMHQAIGDQAAIAFAVGFYKALGANCTMDRAYKFGCVEIQLHGIPEHLTPVLYQKKNIVRVKWILELNATIDDLDEKTLEVIIDYLRQVSGDASITLRRIEEGSIKLFLEGSQDGMERIKALFRSGQLTEISGITVQQISQEDTGNIKHVTFASEFKEKVLVCCYMNATSKIQIARITNIPNWYFERVVFPRQRLVFEALSQAVLEIHTGTVATAILSDRIPCERISIGENSNYVASAGVENKKVVSSENQGTDLTLELESGWIRVTHEQ